MLRYHPRVRVVAPGLLPAVAVLALLAKGNQPARGFVIQQPPTLSAVCKMADQIAVLRVEKINAEKKAIVYSKVRDLKVSFPGGYKEYLGAHILRKPLEPAATRETSPTRTQ